MKKMFILGMTVLILSLAFVGCGGDDNGDSKDTTGGLTITSITGVHEGKYAYATNGSFNLVGVSSNGKTALISGGSVVLTVYNSTTQAVYKGNDTVTFTVAIYNTEVAVGPSMGSPETSGSVTVTFNNGIASGIYY